MKFLIPILVFSILSIVGIFIKKSKNPNLIAGFNSNDNSIDKGKLTQIIGNGLIYIGAANTFIVVVFILMVEVFKYELADIYTAAALLVNTLLSVIVMIYSINKKKNQKVKIGK